jgi:hypothetical protein
MSIDHAIVGMTYLAEGIYSNDQWREKMVEDFGEQARPYLRDILLVSHTLLGERDAPFDDDRSRAARLRLATAQMNIYQFLNKNNPAKDGELD